LRQLTIWDCIAKLPVREIATTAPIRGALFLLPRHSSQHDNPLAVLVHRRYVTIWTVRPAQPDRVARYETFDNPHGLCATCGPGAIAFPGTTKGQVQLVDVARGDVRIIPAHTSAITAMAASRDGGMLATASDKGTLVRLWSTETGGKLGELRRGMEPAFVFSLAFSPSGSMLACASDTGTLHVFDVLNSTANFDDTRSEATTATTATEVPGKSVKATLGQIPFMPRYFRDATSFASAPFVVKQDSAATLAARQAALDLDVPRLRAAVVGWPAEDTVVVVGCGANARYDQFKLVTEEDGTRKLVPHAWTMLPLFERG
jgi:WD repeat-containing protein 45